jgi:hypothetical protein
MESNVVSISTGCFSGYDSVLCVRFAANCGISIIVEYAFFVVHQLRQFAGTVSGIAEIFGIWHSNPILTVRISHFESWRSGIFQLFITSVDLFSGQPSVESSESSP